MNKLILVRHGETEVNARGQTHKTNDSATLTELGITQMKVTAKRLKEFGVSKIICSDEKRAIESATIIAEKIGIELSTDKDLRERNWGELEGKPWTEIKIILDKMKLEQRYTYIPPKGESWQSFEDRIYKAIDGIIKNSDEQTILVVTHGGVIRALIPKLLDLPKEGSFKYDPDNASITIVNYENGKYSAEQINSTEHLAGLDKIKTKLESK